MTSAISTVIEDRISANNFDNGSSISDSDIAELVRLATLAPSSFNFQNWKFIAVRSFDAKERLRAVAFGQPKVSAASVTFIVCGLLAPQNALSERLRSSVAAGILDGVTVAAWQEMANGMYGANQQFQRDEAIRSASLAGMTLMLAAQGMGLASGPMIGFDADGVSREFGLAADEIPALLIAVGKRGSGNWPRKPRRPVAEVLTIV